MSASEPEGRRRHDIAVACATYRRPQLLAVMARHVLDQLHESGYACRLVIIDNDPGRSAETVLPELPAADVTYVHEPLPGLAAARNAALAAAAGARAVVFIDDDEVPAPGWLRALVDAWERWQCDAVAGPTRPVLGEVADAWVPASGFFVAKARSEGAVVDGAATSNLLVDLRTVARLGLRFDDRFGHTGGEDTLFTRQLSRAGGVIRWTNQAITTEPVPEARASRAWILSRELRTGSTWSRVHLTLARGRAEWMRVAARLVAIFCKLVVTGSARCLLGSLRRDLPTQALGTRELSRAHGVLLGVFGTHVNEYARSASNSVEPAPSSR